MEELDREFEEFFVHCQKVTTSEKELAVILKPLRVLIRVQQFKKICKVLLVVGAICSSIYYIDTLNWYFCAIGRIAMIKIIPIYDWTWISEAKCLVARGQPDTVSSESSADVTASDCRACENFGKISVLENTSYSHMFDTFLVRGLPVIVGDSTDSESSQSLSQFIENIAANMSGMIQSEPCSFETNLMISKFASLDEAFNVLGKLIESSNDVSPWFISFRNCKLQAVKASRLLLQKPYFYPRILQAPVSSWLLLSQSYDNYRNELKLYGLIIVTQMQGSVRLILKATDICRQLCDDLSLDLFAGESLVFPSNLWKFSYEFNGGKDFSATFITETDLN